MDTGRNANPPTSASALQADHERYRAIIESQLEAVCRYRADGSITFANPAYSSLFARTPEEMLNLNLFSLLGEDVLQNIRTVIQSHEIVRFEHSHQLPSGEVRWQQWIDQPIFDDNGQVTEYQGVGRDITDRKHMEDALKHTESLYRNLVRNLPDMGVLLFDHDLRYLLVEGTFFAQTGFNKEKAEGKTLFEIVSPEVAQILLPHYLAALKGQESTFERSVNDVVYSGRATSVRDEAGLVMGGMLLLRDITAHKAAENTLRESQRFIQKVNEIAPDLIMVFELSDWGSLYFNQDTAEVFGYTAAELQHIGGLPAIMHPEDLLKIPDHFKHLALLGDTDKYEYEFRAQHKNGQWRWYQSHQKVFNRDDAGNSVQILAVIRDVSKRKQTEIALHDSEELFRQFAENTERVFWMNEVGNPKPFYINPAFEKIFGIPPEAIISGQYSLLDFAHPDDQERMRTYARNLLEEGANDTEFRIVRLDGSMRWILTRTFPIRNQEGEIYRIGGMAEDITRRKQAELQSRESDVRFRQLAENIEHAFWILSSDSKEMLYISPAYETIWGRTCASMYENPLSFTESIHPEDFDLFARDRLEKMQNGTYDVEYRILRPDGDVRWVHSRAFPIRNEQGEVYRIAGVSEDISDRKEMQKKTFDLALEKENIRLVSDFIRNTSHDLRTPLSTISLGVFMLSKTDDAQKRLDRAKIIDQQIARLNFLIDEVHEMSRLDNVTQVSTYMVNLNVIIESLIARSTTAFTSKSLRTILDLKPDISTIKADERDIGLAMKSILDNAIQYTPPAGSITVRTYVAEGQVVAEVQDTGVGIPPEDLPYIFERFYKVNKSRTGDGSGAGLGLSIAQRVVQMHGGHIEVASAPGEGSTFRVVLPAVN